MAPEQPVLGFAEAVDGLLLLSDSPLELAPGDVEVNGILSDELVPPLEEPEPAAHDNVSSALQVLSSCC